MRHGDGAKRIVTETDEQRSSGVCTKADPDLKQVYLHPGDIYVSRQPANISIILGSCVAVCIYNPRLKFGGATHYLLPSLRAAVGPNSPRYGDFAIKQLLDQMKQAGSKKIELQAHVYGGASVLDSFRASTEVSIGNKNVRLALDMLAEESILIVKRETGGEKGRKITMRTDTGEITRKTIGG
jgi:chemotaxis protein CheD